MITVSQTLDLLNAFLKLVGNCKNVRDGFRTFWSRGQWMVSLPFCWWKYNTGGTRPSWPVSSQCLPVHLLGGRRRPWSIDQDYSAPQLPGIIFGSAAWSHSNSNLCHHQKVFYPPQEAINCRLKWEGFFRWKFNQGLTDGLWRRFWKRWQLWRLKGSIMEMRMAFENYQQGYPIWTFLGHTLSTVCIPLCEMMSKVASSRIFAKCRNYLGRSLVEKKYVSIRAPTGRDTLMTRRCMCWQVRSGIWSPTPKSGTSSLARGTPRCDILDRSGLRSGLLFDYTGNSEMLYRCS